jgi:hypothetical protein
MESFNGARPRKGSSFETSRRAGASYVAEWSVNCCLLLSIGVCQAEKENPRLSIRMNATGIAAMKLRVCDLIAIGTWKRGQGQGHVSENVNNTNRAANYRFGRQGWERTGMDRTQRTRRNENQSKTLRFNTDLGRPFHPFRTG